MQDQGVPLTWANSEKGLYSLGFRLSSFRAVSHGFRFSCGPDAAQARACHRSVVQSTAMATTRSAGVGPATRPVAVPDDVDDPSLSKAAGRVMLPQHIRWSGRADYDLADRRDRISAYEQVLTEGTADDVRYFIDVDELVALWDELVLSPHVRAAWDAWLRGRRLA